MNREMGRYDDIIDLPHHISSTRKPMPMEARAAQFAPFAALHGHDEMINESARYTDCRPELSEEERHRLSQILGNVMAMTIRPRLRITCFEADLLKPGGHFLFKEGRILKINEDSLTISLDSGDEIIIDEIVDIVLI